MTYSNRAGLIVEAPGERPLRSTALEVIVLYTDIPATRAALRTAAQLACGLDARIRLIAFQCVPFPMPLEDSPVSLDLLERRFRTLAGSCPADTCVDIHLCRDAWQTLRARLAPRSVIVIGKRSRWWPRAEDWLARKLRSAGHHVVRTVAARDLAHA